MTESEKGEPKPAASVSGDNGSDASRVSEAAAGAANESTDTEKKEEGVASPEPMPEPVEEKPISPGVTL
ncbi:MAG: hypothetical protein ACE5FU_02050, partial [Nitrospinota bacterium]